jgi:8-amino-3,8-dideoxy-alpha-D-manno-octulosonate transaminase
LAAEVKAMPIWTRRTFLATAAATTALAAEGGTPVRKTPLRPRLIGPLYYDESEWAHLTEVFKTRSPFRFWGSRSSEPPRMVATFEKEFAARMQRKYTLAVSAGTTALEAAIAALGVGPGDEVIVPAWTWHSCFHAVVRCGGLPICAEVDESFNLDPRDVERHITPQTKAMMIVHLQGNPADIGALMEIARRRGLKVLEDCSQAVGASYKGRPIGAYGDISITSLQVNKTISAGEGGAVYTDDPALFERAARFHDTGTTRAVHEDWLGGVKQPAFIGSNFRMTEFTGAVMLAQIRKLDRIVSDLRGVAKRVYDGVKDLNGIEFRKLPDPAGDLGAYVFLGFPGKERRDRFQKLMAAENVPAGAPGGSVVLPLTPAVMEKRAHHPDWPTWNTPRGRAIEYGEKSCPKTLAVLNRFSGVGLDPKYTEQDTADIVAAIRKVYPRVMGT